MFGHSIHRAVAVVLLAVFALAGCETVVPQPRFPELSFSHLRPIRLDVARIEIVSEYRPSTAKPNVEHLFPVKPEAVVRRWAKDRLWPAGPAGVARMTIKRAGVVEVPLKRTSGLRGMLTTDQSERYDGVIEVEIRIFGAGGKQRGIVRSRAERSRSVAEDITLHERETVWFQMTEAMMNDLNSSLEKQIRSHLQAMLR